MFPRFYSQIKHNRDVACSNSYPAQFTFVTAPSAVSSSSKFSFSGFALIDNCPSSRLDRLRADSSSIATLSVLHVPLCRQQVHQRSMHVQSGWHVVPGTAISRPLFTASARRHSVPVQTDLCVVETRVRRITLRIICVCRQVVSVFAYMLYVRDIRGDRASSTYLPAHRSLLGLYESC